MNAIQKIRKHVADNKVTYIACGATAVVVAGVTYGLVGRPALVNAKAIQILPWKSTQTIEIFVEALGDPGNIIQDLSTGTVYASQGQAAKALGLSASEISRHLNGLTNHVKGHTFKRLGKAMVSEAPANV